MCVCVYVCMCMCTNRSMVRIWKAGRPHPPPKSGTGRVSHQEEEEEEEEKEEKEEEDTGLASQAVDATHHRQVPTAFSNAVCRTLLRSFIQTHLELEDFSKDYKDKRHQYSEGMFHTLPRPESKTFVDGRHMKWPAKNVDRSYSTAPPEFVALGEALREINRPVLERLLDACGAAPLLTWENAFGIVSLQSHWGEDTPDDTGSRHRHVDFLWRAVTASITLKGTRVIHNELAAIRYRAGDGYFACPLVEQCAVFEKTFNSKAAHFAFAVPRDKWKAASMGAVKALQLKFLTEWPKHQASLRFPTAQEYWDAFMKTNTSMVRHQLGARVGVGATYFKQWGGPALKPLVAGHRSIRKMAGSAECPAFDLDGMPIMAGASALVKDLRLYRGVHKRLSDNDQHLGSYRRVKPVLLDALTTVPDSSTSWFHSEASSKSVGAKTIFRSSAEELATPWECPATTAYPALHAGHFDPAHSTVFGAEFYERKHEEGMRKRVALVGGVTAASRVNFPLDNLKDFIYAAMENGIGSSQPDKDRHGPWNHMTTCAYDFSVHCMSCNTPPHNDNKKGDGPGHWVGVLCDERTFFIFRNNTTGALVVIILEEGDLLFFSGVLREHSDWPHLCLRDRETPDTQPLFALGKPPFPQDARYVLQIRLGLAKPSQDDQSLFEAPSNLQALGTVHTTGCFVCGAAGVCVDPILCDEVFEGQVEGIGRQDISRALLQKDGSGDQDRPFWRSTRTHKQVESLMEIAQADPARVHEHLCVQDGPSIATIAHANSIIDEHDDLSSLAGCGVRIVRY